MKAYFCNNPIKVKKWEVTPGDDLRWIKRTPSSRSDRNDGERKRYDLKRFPNDNKFYLPKSQSNKTEISEPRVEKNKKSSEDDFKMTGIKSPSHPYITNLDNLNKIFANTSIDDGDDNDLGKCNNRKMLLFPFGLQGTSYFDSLMPHGDNQDYVDRLQQDIKNIREEYAAARKNREDFLARNKALDTWLKEYRNKEQEERVDPSRGKRENKTKTQESRVTNNRDLENLFKRSFWDDLTNIKVKLSKKPNCSSKSREEDSDTRESWYRTSRRFTNTRVRRSVRKKPIRERLSTSYKDGGKTSKKQTRPFNKNVDRRGTGETKKIYDEILDILNVNSPNALPFGKDRMAHWLLTSRTSPSF